MPNIVNITPTYAICGQITTDDIAEISGKGIKLVVNMRPDGEEGDQPMAMELGKHLEASGVRYVHIPVKVGEWKSEDVSRLLDLLEQEPEVKTLAFCKSGMRAAALWVLANYHSNLDEGLNVADRANINLRKMKLDECVDIIHNDMMSG